MKFNDVVAGIGTLNDLKRIASAHVVDHKNLNEQELRNAIVKVRPQYTDLDTVRNSLDIAFSRCPNHDHRILAALILEEILLNEEGYILQTTQTEERVMAIEQKLLNLSNETDISDLAAGKSPNRFRDYEIYDFVLRVAWDHQDSISPDEDNLLRKLRHKLRITELDHRIMESKLGKFPKANNEIHSRGEIREARRFLQGLGLLFTVRDSEGIDLDVIPEELVVTIRLALGKEIKQPNYAILLKHKLVRKKPYLQHTLDRAGVGWNGSDTLEILVQRVLHSVSPSILLGGSSPKDGLSNDELHQWCFELGLPVSGTKHERVMRIIAYYDSLRQVSEPTADERAVWYDVFEELARRDISSLRALHIISKDIEIERKFEDATAYLFEHKLNHTPLKQPGTDHPDGLLSFKDMYVMWDNKSKETEVSLRDHVKQFHNYMEKADKPVPVFMVIAPSFTQDSEMQAVQYTAQNLGRNIVLITAAELKALAEEWSSELNKRREEPFPLGLFARTGRFNRGLLGDF
ncbi:MAG TPA: hypothetical protein GX716_01020 [Firmicutes bacterium]|jgi:hypothetical protein|nr:hypothetical protein [Candidatus Fermentithermobacillaceae bacterium]